MPKKSKKNKKQKLNFEEQRRQALKKDGGAKLLSKNAQAFLKYAFIALIIIALVSSLFVYQVQIRKFLGIKNKPKPVDEKTLKAYRTRLTKFYEKHNPDKLGEVEETLEQWKGKEKLLFKKLHQKYVKPKKEEEKRRKEEEKNLTPGERMKRKKERNRAKRREERRAERDIDDEEELTKRKKRKKYFSNDDRVADDNICIFDGMVEVEDWKPTPDELLYGVALY